MNRRVYGLRAWLWQRLTAIYIAVFLLVFIAYLATGCVSGYPQWHQLFAATPMKVATLLFFAAVLLHAWVGVRDILIDYVRKLPLRLFLLSVVGLSLLACAAWVLQILLTVGV